MVCDRRSARHPVCGDPPLHYSVIKPSSHGSSLQLRCLERQNKLSQTKLFLSISTSLYSRAVFLFFFPINSSDWKQCALSMGYFSQMHFGFAVMQSESFYMSCSVVIQGNHFFRMDHEFKHLSNVLFFFL